jgi:hypothetical protein
MAGESVGDNWGDSSDGVLQLIVDQVEELIITILEEIRTRPAVAAAILAGVVGAIVGSALAARMRRPRRPPSVSAPAELLGALAGTLAGAAPSRVNGKAVGKAAKAARQSSKRAQKGFARARAGDMADLANIGLRLLENPIVRSYARAAIANQLRKRFSR